MDNNIMLYTRKGDAGTTKDFKSYSKTQLLYDQGFNVIDATIQQQGNKYVMILKDETKKPVRSVWAFGRG